VVGGSCGTRDVDAGTCATWDLNGVYGAHTIHVAFPGYRPADVQVNVLGPSQGCCPGPIQVDEHTLTLTKQ
jgi:hypothetical protein